MPIDFFHHVANIYQAAIELSSDERFRANTATTREIIEREFTTLDYGIKSEDGSTSIVDMQNNSIIAKSGCDLGNTFFPFFQDESFNDPASFIRTILIEVQKREPR